MIPAPMPAFDRKYSEAQRDAVIFAYVDRNLSASRVEQLAAQGELKARGGDTLEPFKVPEGTIRSLARRAVAERRGRVESPIAEMPAPDANELLRRRLVNLCAAMLEHEEKHPEKADPERVRQIARAVREAEQIRGAAGGDPRPRHARDGTGLRQSGGLAGALLKDHRRSAEAEPATNTPTHPSDDGEHARSEQTDEPSSEHEHSEPGSLTSEQTTQLVG